MDKKSTSYSVKFAQEIEEDGDNDLDSNDND